MSQISLSAFTNFNSAVPWGLWVSIYIWLVGISAGSFCLVMWGNFKENSQLKKVTRIGIILSISTLLVGLLSILIDLGHIERFYRLFISPNPASVMAWVVWLYGIYFVILAVSLRWFKLKKEIPKPNLGLAVIFAVAILLIESLLFALPPAKSWHSLIFPIHFLTSSLVSAIAALIFIVGIVWPKGERKELLKGLSRIALPIIIVNLSIEIIDMVYYGSHIENTILLLGNIIAIILLLTHKSLTIILAGAIELIDILLSKYNSLISAQLIEPFKGLESACIEPRLQFSYIPTLFEYLVALALVCSAVILFYFLYKVFPITKEA